ncbi:carbamoyltransferase C-terminal domain-containing protein [Streptomyces sp. NPDC054783]
MTGDTPFSRRRALVTGGGSQLCERLLDSGGEVDCADCLRLRLQTLDVGSLGTRNALAIAERDGARLLLTSTSEVYGDPLVHPQHEGCWDNVNPVGPRSVYDESKRFAEALVTAHAGSPRFADPLREYVQADEQGGFRARPVPWAELVPARPAGGAWSRDHADLAASAQLCLEEAMLALARSLRERTGEDALTMAGGVGLNCVANTRLWRESGFRHVWVQPAAGDAGTAPGAAAHVAGQKDTPEPMPTAALGRGWSDVELREWLERAAVPYEEPADVAETAAAALAADGIVAWFQGRSEYGPRALGHRSLLAHPGKAANLERLDAVKGREEFRPVAPMVLAERAAEIFDGPLPSPHMLFVHDVAADGKARIQAVVHVDGTARIQTADRAREPLVARMIDGFERRTGPPAVVNTSLNTAGRPRVDDPRDALECFGSAPVDLLPPGPFAIRRGKAFA